MKIRLDPGKCQGFGMCVGAAPELFGLREGDGYGFVRTQEAAAEHREKAEEAASACPMRAIEIID